MPTATEFSLIEKYFTHHSAREDVALGVGDDCALLSPPQDKQLAVTVDTLVAGVHFPVETSPEDIAYKSLAVSLSDLAAMGAEPAWATLAITLPNSDENWLEKFASSFKKTLQNYGLQLIGGDTTQGPLSITVQLTGFVDSAKVLRRDAAKPGDRIYVTGCLGDAAVGLKILDIQDFPDLEIKQSCLTQLNRPVPRVEFAQNITQYCSCAIDISDGLLADLGHIIKASTCGAKIYFDRLPKSKAFAQCATFIKNLNYENMLLAGGDDYELCFTAAAENEEDLFALAKAKGVMLTHIGEINLSGELLVIDGKGAVMELSNFGYEHFSHD